MVFPKSRRGTVGIWQTGPRSLLNGSQIYTVSQDGALFQWNYTQKIITNGNATLVDAEDAPSQWRIVQRRYFMQNNAKVKCAAFHAESNLLVAGFSNGLFGLYELPEFNMIHTLRYSLSPLILAAFKLILGVTVSHIMK